MPANPSPDDRRGNLPQALFWGGMGLAPLAVLILLFGQSTGALRVAVVLAVLTIVLLAVSIAMRPSVDVVRVDIEHRVLDEMERIRLRAREETAAAARTTHRALAEQIVVLNETVQHLRAQVDEVQANAALFDPAALGPVPLGYHAPAAIEPPAPAPPGTIRRTETVQVTRRTTYDDTGTIYGSRAAHDHRGGAVDAEWHDDDRGVEDRWRSPRHEEADDRSWSIGRPDPPALPPARADDRFGDRYEEHFGDRFGDRYERDRGGQDRGRGHDHDGYGRDRGFDDRGFGDRGFGDRGFSDRGPDDRRFDDRGYERDRERDWSPERGEPGYGRGPDREYGHDRRPERDHDRGYERDRGGYERDRYEPDRGHQRDRGYERDRGYDRDRGYERGGQERDGRGRDGYERGGFERGRGYDRGPGYERDRGYGPPDRGYERDRGYQRPGWDRPRSPHW